MVQEKNKKSLIIFVIILIVLLVLLAFFWDDIFGGLDNALNNSKLTATCGDDLYKVTDCEGKCDTKKGQECLQYNKNCYICACPDLFVSVISANVTKQTSTRCSGESNQSCSTICSLRADAQVKIKNSGRSKAGSSVALIDFAPSIGQEIIEIVPLDFEESSKLLESNFSISETVAGRSNSCFDLSWWNVTYVVTATSDYENSVIECNEENNKNIGQTSSN